MRTKCVIFGEALKIEGQKYDKLSLKIVQKALKWPLQCANFQNFFGRAYPRTHLESFLLLWPTCLKLNLSEKSYAWKLTKIGALSLKKNCEYAPDMKTFSKGLFKPVSGSTRFCIWLTFKLIQKYIYLTKTLWIRFCIQRMVKCDVILKPPSLQNPGYASGSLLVRICDFFIFLSSSVLVPLSLVQLHSLVSGREAHHGVVLLYCKQ